jgi:hypothetical protein
MKLFYTGPVVNAEMLVMMLEKHGIAATQSFVDAAAPDDGDLSRPAQVFVPEADSHRAHHLFYAEREDELWVLADGHHCEPLTTRKIKKNYVRVFGVFRGFHYAAFPDLFINCVLNSAN